MKRKLSALSLVLALALCFTACSSDKPSADSAGGSAASPAQARVISLKVSHPRPIDSDNDILTKKFLAEVQQALGEARFTYKIYPNSELGDYTVVQEAVSMGEVGMCMQSVSTNVDQSLTLATAPYLVENWAQARAAYNSTDGVVSLYIRQQLEKQNIRLLAMIPKYFNAISAGKEPASVKDLFAPKGMKMRVPTMKSYELVAKTLGYEATPMNFSEVFTSMQTGIVDGCFGGGPEAFYSNLREVTKYLLLYRNAFEPHWLMMNLDDWKAFSPEEQAQVTKIAADLEAYAFDEAEKNDRKYIDLLRDGGTVIIDFSDEQVAEISRKVRTEVWPQLESVFGKETFDKVKAAIGFAG